MNEAAKTETRYYNPVQVKNHTFIINPEVAEPAVQIFYDLTVVIDLSKPEPVLKTAPAAPTTYTSIAKEGVRRDTKWRYQRDNHLIVFRLRFKLKCL